MNKTRPILNYKKNIRNLLIYLISIILCAYILLNLNLSFYFIILIPLFIILSLLLIKEFRNIILDYKSIIYFLDYFDKQNVIIPPLLKSEKLLERTSKLESIINQLNTLGADKDYSDFLLRRAEIISLQNQINPHFLYNTLDSIRGQALKDNAPIISEMIGALSSLFRYRVSNKGDMVMLEEELEYVDNYFLIQQYRFNNRFVLNKKIEDPDKILGIELPKLTIQPIVENSIYHGFERRSGKGIITIRAYTTQSNLIISIEDNGVGMSAQQVEKLINRLNKKNSDNDNIITSGTSVALTNINQRIKLNFGNEFGLNIYSTKGRGTEVEIVIPFKDKEAGP